MPGSSNSPPSARPITAAILCVGVMLLAAAVRIPGIGQYGYFTDELWTSELACGRGSVHLNLPFDVVATHPPNLFDLKTAPPWWSVWTHMECTHPPLYFLLLRIWMNIFGQGDGRERMLSALASVVAVGLLFDAARLLNGTTVAFWACVLMALAEPQIDHARQTRNYAMLLATTLAAVDAMVRIEKFGVTFRRAAGLGLSVLATLLTHYFCIGALAALGIYGLMRTHGRDRKWVIAAFALAGVVFLICWGPFMWRQRELFSTADQSAMFLAENDPAHVRKTLERLLLVPTGLLVPPAEITVGLGMVTAVLYVLPFALRKRDPGLLLWVMLLDATVGLLFVLDLARQTQHLEFVRYFLLAGPAVYVLIPAVTGQLKNQKWLMHVAGAAVAVNCIASMRYSRTWISDPHEIISDLRPRINPDDFLVFVGINDLRWTAGLDYLLVTRYLFPLPCPIALVDRPAAARCCNRPWRVDRLPCIWITSIRGCSKRSCPTRRFMGYRWGTAAAGKSGSCNRHAHPDTGSAKHSLRFARPQRTYPPWLGCDNFCRRFERRDPGNS